MRPCALSPPLISPNYSSSSPSRLPVFLRGQKAAPSPGSRGKRRRGDGCGCGLQKWSSFLSVTMSLTVGAVLLGSPLRLPSSLGPSDGLVWLQLRSTTRAGTAASCASTPASAPSPLTAWTPSSESPSDYRPSTSPSLVPLPTPPLFVQFCFCLSSWLTWRGA